jgi:hypothetical protein
VQLAEKREVAKKILDAVEAEIRPK